MTDGVPIWKMEFMKRTSSIAETLAERRMSLVDLEDATGLDRKVVEAIVHGRYTPSPEQRRRVAAALGVDPQHLAWGHASEVQHIHGHGPQFGRSP